ncbi:MAG TPA: RNA pseudouridine synthase [Chlamydiales bacterium]|nr:RNA pseudouridine synthase [Chlamydiales bacterium]
MKSSDSAPDVIFCDNHLLIALKPAGLLTQPDATGSDSLEEFAKEWVKKEYNKPGAVFLHCIHRIDRPVSGLVLFARTSKALSRLNEQSRLMEIQRVYLAEVQGILAEKLGRLEHYLIHAEHRALIGKPSDPEAKQARLTFEVLHYLQHTTLVKIELETGRYHQIRAQFSAIGHPIVGDQRYGSQTGDGKTIHLHCASLAFKHPVTQEVLRFESPAPFA